jgi:hypothetical protein
MDERVELGLECIMGSDDTLYFYSNKDYARDLPLSDGEACGGNGT